MGCASASAGGGDCGQGALSAGFGAAASVATANLGLSQPAHFVVTVVAGGVGAELGGGKFVNGASTAAMGYLMNWIMHVNGTYYGGDVTKAEADQHYQNCKVDCNVHVEAAKVPFANRWGTPGAGKDDVWLPSSADAYAVYGQLKVTGTGSPSEYVILTDRYDFEMHAVGSFLGWPGTALRNFGTQVGGPGKGTPFWFFFTGTAK